MRNKYLNDFDIEYTNYCSKISILLSSFDKKRQHNNEHRLKTIEQVSISIPLSNKLATRRIITHLSIPIVLIRVESKIVKSPIPSNN